MGLKRNVHERNLFSPCYTNLRAATGLIHVGREGRPNLGESTPIQLEKPRANFLESNGPKKVGRSAPFLEMQAFAKLLGRRFALR